MKYKTHLKTLDVKRDNGRDETAKMIYCHEHEMRHSRYLTLGIKQCAGIVLGYDTLEIRDG